MYKSLQASRAVAAIMVLLFHMGATIALPKYFSNSAFDISGLFGKVAVQFFFVMSGFIILNAHRKDINKPERIYNYIFKRCVRIYPTY